MGSVTAALKETFGSILWLAIYTEVRRHNSVLVSKQNDFYLQKHYRKLTKTMGVWKPGQKDPCKKWITRPPFSKEINTKKAREAKTLRQTVWEGELLLLQPPLDPPTNPPIRSTEREEREKDTRGVVTTAPEVTYYSFKKRWQVRIHSLLTHKLLVCHGHITRTSPPSTPADTSYQTEVELPRNNKAVRQTSGAARVTAQAENTFIWIHLRLYQHLTKSFPTIKDAPSIGKHGQTPHRFDLR